MEKGSDFRTAYGLMKQFGGGGYPRPPLTEAELTQRFREIRKEKDRETWIGILIAVGILLLIAYIEGKREAYNKEHETVSSQTLQAPNQQEKQDYQHKPNQQITLYNI